MRVLVEQTEALADLEARRTQQRLRGRLAAGTEEHAVPRLRADALGQSGPLRVGDVLGDRTAELAGLVDHDVREALGAALLGPLLPGVERTARLRAATGHDDGTDVRRLEHAEGRVGEEVGDLGDLEAEAQVGLVRAVPGHRVGVRDARERRAHVDALELPDLGDQRLAQLDDVVLVDEAHLDVELRELGLPVGAEVLVAVAAGDLVVALHAGHHEQLLEQLRRLRERVPGARRQARGHDEVAGTLRRRARQRRGLDLDEVACAEHAARGGVHVGPQTHRGGRLGPTQVEVAVAQPRLLAHGDPVVDLERQRRRGVEDGQLGGRHLDRTRREVRVGRVVRPDLDDAVDGDAVLVAQRVRAAGSQDLVTDDDLHDPARVSQVQEGHPAEVSPLGHPSGQRHLLTCVLSAQCPCLVRTNHDVPL